MSHYSDGYRRRSVRLQTYDYRHEGAYFITICTHHKQLLFGEIIGDTLHHSPYGKIAHTCWDAIPNHFPHVECDAFVVMPNHIHGILLIVGDIISQNDDAGMTYPPTIEREFSKPIAGALSTIIGAYKASVTRIIRQNDPDMTTPIWHRNYYEHIIRDEIALISIRNYIVHNPQMWHKDTFYGK